MNARDVGLVLGILLIIATLFGGIAGISDPHLKNRTDKAKIVIYFAVALITFGILVVNYARDQKSASEQSTARKESKKFHDAVLNTGERIEQSQEVTQKGIDEIRSLLMRDESENEEALSRRYPYGYVVFGGKTGGFVHLPFRNSFVEGERVELHLDWSQVAFGEHPRWVATEGEPPWLALSLPNLTWWVEDENGERSHGEQGISSITALRLRKGYFTRFLDCPGKVNVYIEVLDDDATHPAFVLGFRKQNVDPVAEGYQAERFPVEDANNPMALDFEQIDTIPILSPDEHSQLDDRYPHGFMLFTQDDGAFARLHGTKEFKNHLSLVVGGDFRNTQVYTPPDSVNSFLFLPEIHWATINDDGDIVGEQGSTFLSLAMPRENNGIWIRPKNRPGQINCYVEFVEREVPVFILGFRAQPINEVKQHPDAIVMSATSVEEFHKNVAELFNRDNDTADQGGDSHSTRKADEE